MRKEIKLNKQIKTKNGLYKLFHKKIIEIWGNKKIQITLIENNDKKNIIGMSFYGIPVAINEKEIN